MHSGYPTRSAWNWRPIELAALVVGLIAWWPLGLAVLAWKFWNDRAAAPKDLEDALRDAAGWIRGLAGGLFAPAPGPTPAADDIAPTGNAAFDAHIRETLARIDSERQGLVDEIKAFRAFVAQEQAGRSETYERFRKSRRM